MAQLIVTINLDDPAGPPLTVPQAAQLLNKAASALVPVAGGQVFAQPINFVLRDAALNPVGRIVLQ